MNFTTIIFTAATLTLAGSALAQNDRNAAAPSGGTTTTQTVVTNSANQPVPVKSMDNPGRQPFTSSFSCGNTAGWSSAVCGGQFAVPAGKRLVIEDVTYQANSEKATGQRLWIEVTTTSAGNAFSRRILADFAGASTLYDFHIGAVSTRFYADPGTAVGVHAIRLNSTAGSFQVLGTVSGYLVDAL